MNARLSAWLKDNYADVKSDLFSAFINEIRVLQSNTVNLALCLIRMDVHLFIREAKASSHREEDNHIVDTA